MSGINESALRDSSVLNQATLNAIKQSSSGNSTGEFSDLDKSNLSAY